jgi:DNA-binding NarL/FixJ family response regulator
MNQQTTVNTLNKSPPVALQDAKLKVLVVDDAPMMRERIVELLVDTGLVGIIGLATDVRSALEAIQEAQPQVVILDIGLPGTLELHNGIDVLRWIKQTLPQTHVVMLTNFSDMAYRQASERLGAYAFLDKSREFDQLPDILVTLTKREALGAN